MSEEKTFESKFYAGQEVFIINSNHILKTFISNVTIESTSKENDYDGVTPAKTTFRYHTRYSGCTNSKYIFESIEEALEYLKENIINHADEVKE